MPERRFYVFGPFRMDAGDRVLFRESRVVPLPPKVIETLTVLVESAGQVLSKDELLRRAWSNTFVEEGSLTRTISLLRKALGGPDQEYIATVSKRGYRFCRRCETGRGVSSGFPTRALVLVVLPFASLGDDPAQDYFNDGLTEEMITQLSRLNPERLRVIARTSAMRYKGTRKGIREIGRELNVTHAFEGSVRREAGRVRIAVQLIQVSDETHVWAETYDRRLGEILKLQSEVAQAVAREIRIKLTRRKSGAWRWSAMCRQRPMKPT